jgi:SAM-dependent methyltransferase
VSVAAQASRPAAGLRCPACRRGALTVATAGPLRCAECRSEYPVEDGVVDLLPADTRGWSLAKWTMEVEPIARLYDSRLWRRSGLLTVALGISFEREEATLLDAAGLAPADTVLDLACGPGIYTRSFARRVPDGRVFGLDLSRPMLRAAARGVREDGLANVVLVRGTALDLPLPAAACDAVHCAGALHLFPDVPRVLAEVARVLKRGGRFTVATVLRGEGRLAALAGAVRRRATGMDSFTPAELGARLEGVGLRDVRVHHAERAWLLVSARKPRED